MFLTPMSIHKKPSFKQLWGEAATYVHPRYRLEIHFSLGLMRRYTMLFQRHERCVTRTRGEGDFQRNQVCKKQLYHPSHLNTSNFNDKKSRPHRLTLLNLKTVGIRHED